ncbi:peptidase M61 [Pontibacter qinzhouensis]|uniref:Peptidase M61 n=1 Tax=Pontibacter qinzhouensis TaxID=2603253 RepID=A0A5C8KAB2_9BACT|nr:peptidase M61 [Pontibacter qinzhouensis]TXK49097.1 peptidase M61 [Pontibacter qinzhouensis]
MTLRRTFLLLGLSLCLQLAAFAQQPDRYTFTLDLTKVQNDRVMVTMLAPAIKQQEIVYNMPKIVPGTYSISDFGKFINEFKAYDKSGNQLKTEKLDNNRWKINNATALHKVTYWVDDTFDTPKKEDIIFEPAGTNIEENKNFLLNTFGFIGYFDNMKQVPYELNITKPAGFYGSTPLQAVSTTATSDKFQLDNYMDLADNPLMYNVPDTTVLRLGKTEVLVSVYSPSGKVTSGPVAANVQDILEAQRSYLGGTLPVDKYAFLIYVPEKVGKSGSYGALEHSYSSVYFLPEMPEAQFSSTVRDVAAHEFFHIVTPLSIHSEEIGNFDYIEPKMSKHLWLYEGVTEYFASHVQVYEKLISVEEYMDKVREYIFTARNYYNDTLPFTEMSARVLEEHENQYPNVYQKGALIGLVLDVRLRELSEGQYGLRNLMLDLAKTYGKDKPFQDEELFDKITELTFPEIREFFARYVEGPEPLPLQETFAKVGVTYDPDGTQTVNSYGGFVPGLDQETGRIIVAETGEMDAFGKKIGFKPGDQLLAMNGKEITPETIRDLIGYELQNAAPGSKIEFTVARPNKAGKLKKKKLKGKVTAVNSSVMHRLEPSAAPTAEQLELLRAWLNL